MTFRVLTNDSSAIPLGSPLTSKEGTGRVVPRYSLIVVVVVIVVDPYLHSTSLHGTYKTGLRGPLKEDETNKDPSVYLSRLLYVGSLFGPFFRLTVFKFPDSVVKVRTPVHLRRLRLVRRN